MAEDDSLKHFKKFEQDVEKENIPKGFLKKLNDLVKVVNEKKTPEPDSSEKKENPVLKFLKEKKEEYKEEIKEIEDDEWKKKQPFRKSLLKFSCFIFSALHLFIWGFIIVFWPLKFVLDFIYKKIESSTDDKKKKEKIEKIFKIIFVWFFFILFSIVYGKIYFLKDLPYPVGIVFFVVLFYTISLMSEIDGKRTTIGKFIDVLKPWFYLVFAVFLGLFGFPALLFIVIFFGLPNWIHPGLFLILMIIFSFFIPVLIFSLIPPKNKFLKVFRVVIFIFYLFSVGLFIFSGEVFLDVYGVGALHGMDLRLEETGRDFLNIFPNIWKSIKQTYDSAVKQYRRQIALASGDYFTGMVDEKATVRLGVFLSNIGSVAKIYNKDELVNVFATLKVESIGTEEINISLGCHLQGISFDDKGIIKPESNFSVLTYEEVTFDCIIPANKTSVGVNTVVLVADFDFITSAYIKTYFMEQDRLRSYRREQTDPLDVFKIDDKRPKAIYTQGPIMIGIGGTGFSQPPIGINKDASVGPIVSVTLENMWQGKITEFSSMEIILPEGLEVDTINAKMGLCEKNGSVCLINKTSLKDIYKDADITTLRINTKLTNFTKIMEEMPLSIKNIKITAKYKYKIERKTEVNVRSS